MKHRARGWKEKLGSCSISIPQWPTCPPNLRHSFRSRFESNIYKVATTTSFPAFNCALGDPYSVLEKNIVIFSFKKWSFSKCCSACNLAISPDQKSNFAIYKTNLSLKTHKTQNAIYTRNPISLKLFFGCSGQSLQIPFSPCNSSVKSGNQFLSSVFRISAW